MLVQRGTLRVGDAIVAGDTRARCARCTTTAATRSRRPARRCRSRSSASTSRRPPASVSASSRTSARRAQLAEQRGQRLRPEQLAQRRAAASRSRRSSRELQEGEVKELNIILKGDVSGSVEALVGELEKIQHPEVRVNVIHTGVGGITETDVMLASASNAVVVGFNVRPSAEARAARRARGRRHPHLPRHLPAHRGHREGAGRHARAGRSRRCSARSRCAQLFRVSRLGTIAGCYGHERRRSPQRAGPGRPRRHRRLRDDDRAAQALQGRRPRGRRGLRVRHPARGLQRTAPRTRIRSSIRRTDAAARIARSLRGCG